MTIFFVVLSNRLLLHTFHDLMRKGNRRARLIHTALAGCIVNAMKLDILVLVPRIVMELVFYIVDFCGSTHTRQACLTGRLLSVLVPFKVSENELLAASRTANSSFTVASFFTCYRYVYTADAFLNSYVYVSFVGMVL